MKKVEKDLSSIIKELEHEQWQLFKRKESGEITKEEYNGFESCLFLLKWKLRENNIKCS